MSGLQTATPLFEPQLKQLQRRMDVASHDGLVVVYIARATFQREVGTKEGIRWRRHRRLNGLKQRGIL
jgi:hypothetical protein